MTHHSSFKIKKRRNEKGFTLLEVIVSISVLTIGLLAVTSMQGSNITRNKFAGGVTEATSWASDQIEKLMILPYDHADLVDTDGDGTDQDANDDGIDDDGGDFGLQDTVDEDNPDVLTADHRLKRGKYTIYWNVAVGVEADDIKTISVIVALGDPGIQKLVSIRNIIPNM
jgi:prepilin-type N-terminal cleavage/methylation domain-containing protein